jgi:methylenetetrahydrofolate dehydrogenase (NADP+)/methenyltetrahydrofolate cyclohydrolase
VIDGRAVAAEVRARVTAEVADLRVRFGVTPGLATVLVGDDPASHLYVRRKREACAEAGIESSHHELTGATSQDELAAVLRELNDDARIHGILLQLPVPDQIEADAMTVLIDPAKDVDGLHPVNAGLLMKGLPGMVPCTPAGVIELLRSSGTELRGAEAVVVGRSDLVGRPLAALLTAEDATVTVCHSRTRDLGEVCRRRGGGGRPPPGPGS